MTSAVCRQVPSITYAMLSRPAMQLLAAPYFSSSRARRKVDLQAGSSSQTTVVRQAQLNQQLHCAICCNIPSMCHSCWRPRARNGACCSSCACRARQTCISTAARLPHCQLSKGSCHAFCSVPTDSCQPAHLALVAENAMYSSSLLAPAVASVSMELPPPTNRATQVLGPDTSRAAALTSPTEPVCTVKDQDICFCRCVRWADPDCQFADLLSDGTAYCPTVEGFRSELSNWCPKLHVLLWSEADHTPEHLP